MLRDIFSDEHEHFRAEFRRFVEAEIEPKVAGWNEAGTVSYTHLTLPTIYSV